LKNRPSAADFARSQPGDQETRPSSAHGVRACVGADQQIMVDEAELLRTIADTLDCSMPPILAGASRRASAPSSA